MDRELIINDFLELLEAQEDDNARLCLMTEIYERVCKHCGRMKTSSLDVCHCWNDE
jgi:hypothetical protein